VVFDGGTFDERVKMIQELNPEQAIWLVSFVPIKEVMNKMSIGWGWLINLIASALGPIIGVLTPAIKTALTDFLSKLYLDALKTPNPWDDFAVGVLLDILGIPKPVAP